MRKQIEFLRFSQGLTKAKLCAKAGISEATYYRFIKGGDITLSFIEKISEALNVKLSFTSID